MKSTRDLLKETFASIPNEFAYREVKFYVHQALQRLETLEKRAVVKERLNQEEKLKEEKLKKLQPWMPPIYQDAQAIKTTLNAIDKMISKENKLIEDIQSKKGKTVSHNEPKDSDYMQTLHG
jgi:gamma-glutamylcyclotransferase (GGCT)/AIG2-like uncharacterized protein YtfP